MSDFEFHNQYGYSVLFFIHSDINIIRKTRHCIFVQEDDGKVQKYQRVEKQPPNRSPAPQTKRKAKPKQKAKNVSVLEKADMLPKCEIVLKNLSKTEIDEITAKLKRDGLIRDIKNTIQTLPG